MKRILSFLAIAMLSIASAHAAVTAAVTPVTQATSVVTLNWAAPTTNVDGTPLTPLSGYHVFQAASAAAVLAATTPLATVAANVTSYATSPLPAGTYYFAVTAVAQLGTESAKSNVMQVLLSPVSGAPTNLTIVCPVPTATGPLLCKATAS